METKNISWDNKNQLVCVEKQSVVIIQFVSSSSLAGALVDSFPPERIKFISRHSYEIKNRNTIFGGNGKSDSAYIFFEYPALLMYEDRRPCRMFARFKSTRIVVLRSTVENISTHC